MAHHRSKNGSHIKSHRPFRTDSEKLRLLQLHQKATKTEPKVDDKNE